jgi:hypothetical protein
MIIITFPDRETEIKGLGFLVKHFSGTALKSGEHIVPEAALLALARKNITFTVKGIATYAYQVAALRSALDGQKPSRRRTKQGK